MAAPAAAPRIAPATPQQHLFDGYQTFVSISDSEFFNRPGAFFWEVTVTPPGIDGRDPIDQNTMWNIVWTLVTPRHLKTFMEFTFTCGWDPTGFAVISGYINVVVNISVFYPNGSIITFWGFMRKFEPQEHKEGEMPKATVTITPSMMDPTAPEGLPTIVGPRLTLPGGTIANPVS